MIEKKQQVTTKFHLPKWWLFALLSFFIFSPGAPTSLTPQKVPVQTEQRDEPRSVKTLFHFVKFHQPVSDVNFSFECGFLPYLNSYSNSIDVRLGNRTDQISDFTPIGINLIANFLPRSEAGSLFSNQG